MRKLLLLFCVVCLFACSENPYTEKNLLEDYGAEYPILYILKEVFVLDQTPVEVVISQIGLTIKFKETNMQELGILSEEILSQSENVELIQLSESEIHLSTFNQSLKVLNEDDIMIVSLSSTTEDEKASALLTDQDKKSIEEILKILFTIRESDYFYTLEDYFNAVDRSVLVEEHFLVKPHSYTGTHTPGGSFYFDDYFCTTDVKDVELDVRETSNEDQLVCNYSFMMTSNFMAFEDVPFEGRVTGEMTLVRVDDSYKVSHLNARTREYNKGLLDHIEKHHIDKSKDGYLEYLKSKLAEKIYLGQETYQLSNADDVNNILVFEDKTIKIGYKDGEIVHSFTYSDLDYDTFENSIVFYIIEEMDLLDESEYKVTEVDYTNKLFIKKGEIVYYHKYGSDDMVESHWPYAFEGDYFLITDDEGIVPVLTIMDNRFNFSYDPLSSYFNTGCYSIRGDKLILRTDDEKYHYSFKVDGYDLRFLMDESSSVTPISEMGPHIENQSIFSHLKRD
ncbi:hypothetical protein EZV73_09730 [Acidaminobacter sp. JC074]|uniref:hypothetical protein n=1 Tax=Acidaminobacter sp. JC074 TaxID=2530199 RepID=UPI001F0F2F04|nr:hypothetical protein [Acidaminobacter sp. JC074]MCH4887853.1 hypothetical protein [Acidaminobacter sp. JC074]